jgi:RimJ/RimL family protein N-acetyltransferase
MPELQTKRLRLLALTAHQLELYLAHPARLEQALGFPISRSNITGLVRGAIRMKLAKMADAEEEVHPWYTYWLVVVADEPYGAGLAGFKGYPDGQGEAEIGYGIDPNYRGRGYTTEAVRALIAWAFFNPDCRSIVAPGTAKSNPASNRVLEKVGMHVYGETEDTLSWRIDRTIPDR